MPATLIEGLNDWLLQTSSDRGDNRNAGLSTDDLIEYHSRIRAA